MEGLLGQRRQLLRLHYEDWISAELFAEEETRLTAMIEAARSEEQHRDTHQADRDDLAIRFEEVAEVLRELDLDRAWDEATEAERRVLIEELVDSVTVHPDHLVVTVHGAPPLNVTLDEVGLQSQIGRVGGGT